MKEGEGLEAKRAVKVVYPTPDGTRLAIRFNAGFGIGRDKTCEIQLHGDVVSKRHAEVQLDDTGWWIQDSGSTNGTYLNGQRIERAPLLPGHQELRIAPDGPILTLEIEGPLGQQPDHVTVPVMSVPNVLTERPSLEGVPPNLPPPPIADRPQVQRITQVDIKRVPDLSAETAPQHPASTTDFIRRYFDRSEVGAYTSIVRSALKRLVMRMRWFYIAAVLAALSVAGVGAAIAIHEHLKVRNLTSLAVEIFYNMKSLEIQIQQIEERLESTGNQELLAEIGEKRRQLRSMQDRYDQFADEIGGLGSANSEEDRLILRMARMFGECEVAAPEGFVAEVKRYIAQWKATTRLVSAIQRAEEGGFPTKVYLEMVRRHLPPQFFYLALQESNFDRFAIGPKTRFGIAKGFWQFIPSTAIRYGLTTGPLVEIRRFDPLDERFDFEKSTVAAAKYIRDMYRTEAQASGLLVMASYNWGHNRVRKRILEMPPDPRERNFWKLLKTAKIPMETYDYVYYIFAAAVIGENPSLFHFDFENPFVRIDEEDVLGPERPPASSR